MNWIECAQKNIYYGNACHGILFGGNIHLLCFHHYNFVCHILPFYHLILWCLAFRWNYLLEALCWWLPFGCDRWFRFVSFHGGIVFVYWERPSLGQGGVYEMLSWNGMCPWGFAMLTGGAMQWPPLCSAFCRNCAVATWPVWTCDCTTIHLHNSIYDYYYIIYKRQRERIEETAQLLTVNPFLNFLMALTQNLFKWLCNIFSFFHSHGRRMMFVAAADDDKHMVSNVSRIALPSSSSSSASALRLRLRLRFYMNKPTSNSLVWFICRCRLFCCCFMFLWISCLY